MKRFSSLCLLLLIGWGVALAQYEYMIEACGGKVEYKKHESKEWHSLVKNMILTTMDSVRILKGGYLLVEYGNTPYRFTDPCAATIYELVNEKKNERAKHFTTKGLLKEIGTNKEQPLQMKQVGLGSKRGTVGSMLDYEALADTLSWIGLQACSGKESHIIQGVVFRKHKISEGELEFEFDNRTSKDYYINILHVNKRTERLSLCYVITSDVKEGACLITPSGFCSYAMDIFFPDTPDDVYILFALDYPYDSNALDTELMFHSINRVKNMDIDLKYMW